MKYQETDWYKDRLKTIAERNVNRKAESVNRNEYHKLDMRARRGKLDPSQLEEAKQRAERSANYASRMPDQVKPDDSKYCTLEWQIANLSLKLAA